VIEFFPLTDAQKRVWLSEMFFPNTSVSNITTRTKMVKPDLALLKEAIKTFLSHQEMIRVQITMDSTTDEPMQFVEKAKENYDIKVVKISAKEDINTWFDHYASTPINLYNQELYQFTIVQWKDICYLAIKCHHIIIDGISITLIIKKIKQIYECLTKGLSFKEKEVNLTLSDYIETEQRYKSSPRYKKDQQFWRSEFGNELPAYIADELDQLYAGSLTAKRKDFLVPDDLKQKIEEFCKENKTSIYTLFMSSLFLYYSRIHNEKNIVLGTYFANRWSGERDLLGMFVSTLAFHMEIVDGLSVQQWIQAVNRKQMKLLRHQRYPYNQLIQDDRLEGKDRKQLFSVGVEYQEISTEDSQQLFGGTDANLMSIHIKNFTIWDKLHIQIDYQQKVFEEEEIDQFIDRLFSLMKAMIEASSSKINQLDICTDAEKSILLEEWSGKSRQKTSVKQTIQQDFEKQVNQTPHQVAIVDQTRKLTYQELNRKANQIAHILRNQGVQPDDRVGIVMECSVDTVIAILAVLKAGGAYVPLDASYPAKRVQYVLEDSNTRLVLSHEKTMGKFQKVNMVTNNWLSIEDLEKRSIADSNLPIVNTPTDLAYVIYTSGTTGNPKGVMVEHAGYVEMIDHLKTDLSITTSDRIGQFASISFDVSIWDIGIAILTGATLYVISDEVISDVRVFEKFVQQNSLSMITLPPPYLRQLDRRNLSCLRQVIAGGSASTIEIVEEWKDIYRNGYGPTEATVWATMWKPDLQQDHSVVSIGKPLTNKLIYILNDHLQLQSIGSLGELCIGGFGLARGYLGKPQLTREKFIDNPFIPGERIYRTGDLARFLPDGNIEFCGRIDHQVKIRGHRVEMGELESVIAAHPMVKNVTVREWKDIHGETYLCAYVVGNNSFSIIEIKKDIEQKLPGYMIPAFFVELKELPLTTNGKVDRKALPEPTKVQRIDELVPPKTDDEQLLVRIWEQVLGIEKVGITDHFFELGGDSIKAIQVASLLQKENKKLSIQHFFRAPTIQKLIHYLEDKKQEIYQGMIEGNVPLSPIQNDFLVKNDPSVVHHYNQAVLLYHSSLLSHVHLQQAFSHLMRHHDALRMKFQQVNGIWEQINQPMRDNLFDITTVDLSNEAEVEKKMEEWGNYLQQSIHISNGPLMRVGHFHTSQGDYLLWIIHHLVVDGVSWRILLEDFQHVYQKLIQDKRPVLSAKTQSYRDWARLIQNVALDSKIREEFDYWEKVGQVDILPLPKDYIHHNSKVEDCDEVTFFLSKEQTTQLISNIHRIYQTEINDILLTAISLSIKNWIHADRIGFMLEGHGREEIVSDAEVHRTVGWFTSMFLVVFDFSSQSTKEIGQIIKEVKETLRRVPNRGIGYSILHHLNSNHLRTPKHPEILFNYLGQFDEVFTKKSIFSLFNQPIGKCSHPQMKRAYTLEIDAIVLNEIFSLCIRYSNKDYDKETMEEISTNIKNQLEMIIKHCLDQTEIEKTPSDFGDTELSLEELAFIKASFES
jgi:amino acid adenylation domain-containing protein/non-ribosomal peptide synthase protein (TIGR01720 family)